MANITCRMTAYLYVEPLDGYAGTSITCNVTLSSGSGTLGSLSISSSSSSYDYTWTKDVSFTSTNTSVTYTLSERSYCGSRTGKGTRTVTGNLQSGSLSVTFNPVYNTSNTASASLRINLEYISGGGGGGGGSTPTATASPPTSVRVGGSSTHSSNAAVYNTAASDSNKGKFYITWTNTGSVTNQTKRGYQRRADGSAYGGSVYIVPDSYTTNLYSLSDGWGSGAVGKTYKCQVRTVGSSVTSNWSSSYGSVKFSAAVTNRTITGNANGGSPNRSKTAAEGTAVEMAAPLRRGYQFGGWYFNSTASNCLDYGTIHNYTSSFTVSFWTYASTYAQGSSTTPVSIVSSAEGAGWCLSCEDGTNWAFQLWDGSRWCEAIYARSNISNGRHYWCLVFDSSAGIIRMYIDGSQKASASVPNKKVVYGSSNHLLLGAELGASNAMASSSGFVGYIGNFKITNDATYRTYQSSEFMIPMSSPTVYAYWSKISGKIYYNAGQYYTGSTNNPQPDMGTIKSGYTMQTYGGHYGFAANSSGTLYSPSYDVESTALDLYNTTTLFDAPPGCKHSPEASQWKIWNKTEGVWVSNTGISAASWNVGNLVSNGTIEPGDELVAFANWLPNTYTLTFNPNGGTCSTTTKTVTYGTTYTDLPTATKEGYVFKGWAANFNGSSDFINYGRRYMFTNNLSAHFSAYMDDWSNYSSIRIASCTEGGGWNFESSSGNMQVTAYDYGVGYKHATASTTWASLSPGWHDFDLVFDRSTVKLYVDRNLLGTSSTFSSSRIGYHDYNSLFVGAESATSPTTPIANSYFSGRIGNISILNSGALQSATYNSFTAPAQNVTLYAIWEQNPVSTVTYVLNGGTYNGSTNNVTRTVDTGSNIVLINPTPYTQSGHIIRFKGWNLTTSGNSLIGTAGDTYKLDSDTILYALYYDTELDNFVPHFVYVYDEANNTWQKVIPYIYSSANDSWRPSEVYIYLENN